MNSVDRCYSHQIISDCRLDPLGFVILRYFDGQLSLVSFTTIKQNWLFDGGIPDEL